MTATVARFRSWRAARWKGDDDGSTDEEEGEKAGGEGRTISVSRGHQSRNVGEGEGGRIGDLW